MAALNIESEIKPYLPLVRGCPYRLARTFATALRGLRSLGAAFAPPSLAALVSYAGSTVGATPLAHDSFLMPRFVILEHTDAPDDPAGRHYDLLLEDGDACRTWRLAELPVPGGPAVEAVELAPHRRAWLDHEAGEVSGGRGFARRVDAGTFEPPPTAIEPASAIAVWLRGTRCHGRLTLAADSPGWRVRLEMPPPASS